MSTDDFGFIEGALDATDNQRGAVEAAGSAPDETTQVPQLLRFTPRKSYNNFYAFMNEYICKQFSRKISEQSDFGLRWDQHWWRYPEAVLRAELMWRSYEMARVKDIRDGTSLEEWLRVVADHHMGVLLNGSFGPMHQTSGPDTTLGGTYPPGWGPNRTHGPDKANEDDGDHDERR